MNDKLDILALFISIIAIGFTIFQYYFETVRRKKEDTLNAFEILQSNVFDNKISRELVDELIKKNIEDRKSCNYWKEITSYLARVEHFCVGVNSGIYDVKLLNRLAGGFFISWYDKLVPIIELKRQDDMTSKHYDELEIMVGTLKKVREK